MRVPLKGWSSSLEGFAEGGQGVSHRRSVPVTFGVRDTCRMLQMVRTLAQFTIALEEMQESGEGTSDDGGGGGTGDETMDRSSAEPNGNGGGGGTGNQTAAEVRASQRHMFVFTCLRRWIVYLLLPKFENANLCIVVFVYLHLSLRS